MATDVDDVPDPRAVLSALLDREMVDPNELARVLDEPDARALLVDFVRLRHELATEVDEGGPALPVSVATVRRGPQVRRWLRPLAAALLLTAVGAGGLWLGERRQEDRPPTPSRIVSYTPGVDWKEKP